MIRYDSIKLLFRWFSIIFLFSFVFLCFLSNWYILCARHPLNACKENKIFRFLPFYMCLRINLVSFKFFFFTTHTQAHTKQADDQIYKFRKIHPHKQLHLSEDWCRCICFGYSFVSSLFFGFSDFFLSTLLRLYVIPPLLFYNSYFFAFFFLHIWKTNWTTLF